MGNLRRTLIKNITKETLAESIKDYYQIGRTLELKNEYQEAFFDQMNSAFIVFDAYIKNWTEVVYDFYNSIDEHDIFLKKLSLDFNTLIISGYEQTTTGDTRFLIFDRGNLIRLIYQKSYYDPHRILMEQNIGKKLKTEKHFNYSEIGENIEFRKHLNFIEIQEMFIDAGFIGEPNENLDHKYLHLEYLK